MPRARGEKDYLSLLLGLNTEANPLAFPEGFTTDEKNFLLDKSGDVRIRRKGLENSAADQTFVSSNTFPLLSGAFYWRELDVILIVVATLSDEVVVRVHRNDADFTYVDEYEIDSTAGALYIPSFSPILSGVVITGSGGNNYVKPILLQKTSSGDIEIYSTQLYFRDFDLIDDNLSISERPNGLTDEHTYNLYNAGWYADRRSESTLAFVDPLDLFEPQFVEPNPFDSTTFVAPDLMQINSTSVGFLDIKPLSTVIVTNSSSNNGTYIVDNYTVIDQDNVEIEFVEQTIVNEGPTAGVEIEYSTGSFPSNADIPVLGLKSDGSGNEVFSPGTLFETVLGSSEAPRGHYVFDVEETRTRDDVLASKQDDGTVPSTINLEATIAL